MENIQSESRARQFLLFTIPTSLLISLITPYIPYFQWEWIAFPNMQGIFGWPFKFAFQSQLPNVINLPTDGVPTSTEFMFSMSRITEMHIDPFFLTLLFWFVVMAVVYILTQKSFSKEIENITVYSIIVVSFSVVLLTPFIAGDKTNNYLGEGKQLETFCCGYNLGGPYSNPRILWSGLVVDVDDLDINQIWFGSMDGNPIEIELTNSVIIYKGFKYDDDGDKIGGDRFEHEIYGSNGILRFHSVSEPELFTIEDESKTKYTFNLQ